MDEVAVEETTALVIQADSVKSIANVDDYHRAVNLRGLIRAMIKKIAEDKTPAYDSAKAHLKLLSDEWDEAINPLEKRNKTLGDLLTAYDTEQERLKKIREQEEDRKQRAADAEKAQLAKLAQDMGNTDLADEILEQPEPPQAVITKDTPTAKDTGVYFKEQWGAFELEDLKIVPIEYHLLNETLVRSIVSRLKKACRIPGIRILPPRKIPVQRG